MEYKINKIEDNDGFVWIVSSNDHIMFTLEHEPEEHGNPTRGLYDFLTDGSWVVSVIRLADNVEFAVGNLLNVGRMRRTIQSIRISNNVVTLQCPGNNRIPLVDAVKHAPLLPRNPQSLDNIQESIINSFDGRTIRLQRLLKRRSETPLAFLIKFFRGEENVEPWNSTRQTIYTDDDSIQTDIKKRRSMGDIFMILKYYYPDITIKEVARLLYVDLFIVIGEGMRSSNCSEISKRVWYYDVEEGGQFMEARQLDEYGNSKTFYVNNTQ